jgi:dipeptidyl aminopeptidase/acylaminoacyl peptidase
MKEGFSMKRKALVIGVLVIALLAVGYYLWNCWYFSGAIVAYEHSSLEEVRERTEPVLGPYDLGESGLPAPEDVSLDVGDGIVLSGWFFENDLDGDCGVILHHGRGGARVETFMYVPLFWDRGCDVMMFDARHHGQSTGEYATYGYYEKEDTLKVLAWFAERTGLEVSQIGLMGVSYGAATVLQAAALEPDLAFVAAEAPFQDLPTLIGEQAEVRYGPVVSAILTPGVLLFAGWRAAFDPAAVSPLLAAREIQAPVFLIHSLQDDSIPPAHTQAIYANIPHDRKVLYVTDWGAPHAQCMKTDPVTFKAYMDDFLGQYVPGFGLVEAEE